MHRSEFTAQQRRQRSRLAQVVRAARFLRGTLALRKVRCGKPSCHCAQGELHACLYLVRRQKGKLRQMFVPRQWEERVRQAVENHEKMEKLIEELSDLEWKRIKQRKE